MRCPHFADGRSGCGVSTRCEGFAGLLGEELPTEVQDLLVDLLKASVCFGSLQKELNLLFQGLGQVGITHYMVSKAPK